MINKTKNRNEKFGEINILPTFAPLQTTKDNRNND